MSTSNRPSPITALLRDTIRDAIASGRTSYNALALEADVAKASIMRFVRGTQSLRLDMADRLAAYFKLALQPEQKGRKGR
jgi:plasmid maintenance system antidote protein VapI